MKTTELFVEQVLIGFLALLPVAILFHDWFLDVIPFEDSRVFVQFAIGAIGLGGAYLVGIVYDRCADTMFGELERFKRITFLQGRNLISDSTVDPFPEEQYRIQVLKSEAASSYMDYLRSRIRLTRALATILPALTFSIVLIQIRDESLDWVWFASLILLGSVYSFSILAKVQAPGFRRFSGHRPFRTDRAQAYLSTKRSLSWFAFRELQTWLFLVLYIGSIGASLASGMYVYVAWASAGFALCLLVTWSWWRITNTFMSFVEDFARFYE
ncbi:MAG: hypothetical protein O3A93_09500 [Chloroflexi bacterium]|nr:hypothetical protein [Chloroflexota bacterium]MDA1271480.1 hypothetical protein [Chloroflexota bacterium]PKB58612.1 MAG: hypothetical protein BZY83_06035 [SAR202 cluster bacterium Casp-Chloro-G2]